MIITAVAIIWILCSALSYGICLNWHKREFNYFRFDMSWKLLHIYGPAALFFTIMIHSGKYGLDFKDFTADERWRNFDKEYNSDGYIFMTREQFEREK